MELKDDDDSEREARNIWYHFHFAKYERLVEGFPEFRSTI